jgi:hypothetical protein
MEAIRDFCEKVFYFCLFLKVRILGNVLIYHELTQVDIIWYEYCSYIEVEKCVRICINPNLP